MSAKKKNSGQPGPRTAKQRAESEKVHQEKAERRAASEAAENAVAEAEKARRKCGNCVFVEPLTENRAPVGECYRFPPNIALGMMPSDRGTRVLLSRRPCGEYLPAPEES